MTDRLDERRMARIVIFASITVFLVLFAVLPPTFETPDEAKYIGLGLNILAGRGLITDFGAQFLNHSPLWPLLLAAPRTWFGFDPLAAGHVLDAASAAIVIALASALAWRVRPAAGALTAVALLATPYLANLARTAGIDLPAAAFALAFLWTAPRAVERDSIRAGLLAGALFGIGFLMKETVLPFAPVPFLIALAGPQRVIAIARVGAAALLTATLSTAWWFGLYATMTHTVYRLGGPVWLLVPIAVVVVAAIILGLLARRIAAAEALRRWLASRRPQTLARFRAVVGWGGLTLWLLGQLWIYAKAAKLGGAALLRASQLADDARAYLPQIGLAIGFGLVGGLLALAFVRRSNRVRELAGGAIAQAPLVLLVLGIGETPRHYIAGLALLTGLGAVGWIAAAERATSGRGWLLVTGAVAVGLWIGSPEFARSRVVAAFVIAAAIALVVVAVGVVRNRRWRQFFESHRVGGLEPGNAAGATSLALAFFIAAGAATLVAVRSAGVAHPGAAEAAAILEVSAWARTDLEPGSTIMVGPALAYELALAEHDQFPVVRLRPVPAVADPLTPLGLRSVGGTPVTDPVTFQMPLHRVDQVDVYGSALLRERVTAVRPSAWIEAAYLGPAETTTPVFAAFDSASGMRRLRTWSFPYGADRLLVVAYAIDPDHFGLSPTTIYSEPAAILALANLLGPSGGAAPAAALLDRIQVVPSGPDAAAAIAALRVVAGR